MARCSGCGAFDFRSPDHPMARSPDASLSLNCQIDVTFSSQMFEYPEIRLEFVGMIQSYISSGMVMSKNQPSGLTPVTASMTTEALPSSAERILVIEDDRAV